MPLPQFLPKDINAEVLLAYYPKGACKISFSGLHKRNTYNDIVELEPFSDDAIHLTLSRNSLYNALPEYMFHPIDRFDNLPKVEEKEMFEKQLEQQAEEIANAYKFFAPIDILLFKLRTQVRDKIESYAQENIIMQDLLGDRITQKQYTNRFIRQLIPFLPQCKYIRGDKTLLTLLLRKVFMEERLQVRVKHLSKMHKEDAPRYADSLDMELGHGYVGNEYPMEVTTYSIRYWPENDSHDLFVQFLDEVETLRIFLQDYFLSIEEELVFDITREEVPLQLADNDDCHYLNYNINI